MKTKDLRGKTPDQLQDELISLKKEQFNLRFQRATGQLENTSRVREVRRDIARLKTIATQKRTGTMPQVADKPAPVAKAQEELIETGLVDATNLLVMDMDLCVRCGNCSMPASRAISPS